MRAAKEGKSTYELCSALLSYTAAKPAFVGLRRPDDDDTGIGLDDKERFLGGDMLGNLNWFCCSVIDKGGRERERLDGRQSIGTRERDLLMARQSIATSLYCDIIH